MRKILASKLWGFGSCNRYLQDMTEDRKVHGENLVLSNLKRLLAYLDEFQLEVSKKTKAAKTLAAFQEELSEVAADAGLTSAQATKLRKTIAELRTTLLAELKTVEAYMLTPKRHSVEALVDDMSVIVGPEVFEVLPEIAQFDLQEAGKCIAFEQPTAAAFHLMRATEATLREFYRRAVRINRVPATMWGPIVAEMRKKPTVLARHKTLLDHLDNIRVNFRNPTQHPEARYMIGDAENLLGVCVDVLSRMAPTIKR